MVHFCVPGGQPISRGERVNNTSGGGFFLRNSTLLADVGKIALPRRLFASKFSPGWLFSFPRNYWCECNNSAVSVRSVSCTVMCIAQKNGLAYDWSSGNFYWTDGEFKLIGAGSGQFWKPIVTTGLTSPQDIAVDPTHAYVGQLSITLYLGQHSACRLLPAVLPVEHLLLCVIQISFFSYNYRPIP